MSHTRYKLIELNACEFTFRKAKARGWASLIALERAKNRKKAWDKKDFETLALSNPSPVFNPENEDKERWIENVSCGLRFAGYCDEIRPRLIDHKGWYCDIYQFDTYRGVVYQLPAHKGKCRYVVGYADPCNDNCAFISFKYIYDDKEDAAYHANRFAENKAEEAREYSAKDAAENRILDLRDEISTERKSALSLIKEIKALKQRADICDLQNVISALKHGVNSSLSLIAAKRAEIEKLSDNFWAIES